MGWGTGAWGTSVWGLGTAATLSVSSAIGTTERNVTFTLTSPPLAVSTIGVGDALNPQTWIVTREDGQVYVTLAVRQISSVSFELYLLQKLGSYLLTHTLSAPSLLEPGGANALLADYDFFGCEAVQYGSTKVGLVDLANPMTSGVELGGVLEVGPDGDYGTESGTALLRKLVIRRLTAIPGDWFYDKTYGLGIRVAEPLRIPDINQLRASAERQVRMEPELATATVKVIPAANGVITFFISTNLRVSNRQVTLAVQVAVAGGVVL